MAETVNLFIRTTHKYAPGYASLDNYDFVGKAKFMPQRQVEEGNGYDEVGTFVRYAKLSVNIDRNLGEKALRDTVSEGDGGHCRHEYDCCGCYFSRSTVERITGRTFKITSTVSRNY